MRERKTGRDDVPACSLALNLSGRSAGALEPHDGAQLEPGSK